MARIIIIMVVVTLALSTGIIHITPETGHANISANNAISAQLNQLQDEGSI